MKFISLTDSRTRFEVTQKDQKIRIYGAKDYIAGNTILATDHAGDRSYIWPFDLSAETWDDYYRLLNLLELYSRYGSNTAFLTSLLSAKGWNDIGSGLGNIPHDRAIMEELGPWDEKFPTTTST